PRSGPTGVDWTHKTAGQRHNDPHRADRSTPRGAPDAAPRKDGPMASTTRSDGAGSIYFDSSRQRYVAVLVTGWREGKPIRKKASATSRAGAATKLRKMKEQVAAGQLPQGRVPTVEEWMTYWLEQVAAERVRPSTYRGYESSVAGYIKPLLGHHRLDRLTPEHIAQAWTHL